MESDINADRASAAILSCIQMRSDRQVRKCIQTISIHSGREKRNKIFGNKKAAGEQQP